MSWPEFRRRSGESAWCPDLDEHQRVSDTKESNSLNNHIQLGWVELQLSPLSMGIMAVIIIIWRAHLSRVESSRVELHRVGRPACAQLEAKTLKARIAITTDDDGRLELDVRHETLAAVTPWCRVTWSIMRSFKYSSQLVWLVPCSSLHLGEPADKSLLDGRCEPSSRHVLYLGCGSRATLINAFYRTSPLLLLLREGVVVGAPYIGGKLFAG